MSNFAQIKMMVPCKDSFWWGIPVSGMAWANQLDDNTWELLYKPETCKSRILDFWWKRLREPEFKETTSHASDMPPETERTQIFVQYLDFNQNRLEKLLPYIYSVEDEAGIPHTTFIPVKGEIGGKKKYPLHGVVFIGDKSWGSTLWKLSIYTLLIGKVMYEACTADEYRPDQVEVFEKFRHKYLKKIKDFNEEIVECSTSYNCIHNDSGFVSIATGYNKPMAELLEIK